MSQAPVTASGLVRVTVASGTRRVDLVLPGAVPLAELLPELARSVGLLDATTVYGGYTVVTAEGRRLAPDSGLVVQGVEDGGLLSVAAGVDEEPPRVYDDVVEAMTDVVERDLSPWEPASGRRTALSAAGLLLALGAVALLVQRESLLAGVAAVTVAAALVAGAVVLSRAQGEPQAAVTVGLIGAAYAAVAGLMLTHGAEEPFGFPVAAAGGAALAAGLVCLLGISEGRPLMLPAAVVGAVFLAAGLVLSSGELDAAVVLTVVLSVVVLLGSVFPWLALGSTRTRVDQLFSVADITADPADIDPERVGTDARVAHQILLAISATVGILLVLIAPLTVSLGLFGVLLAVVASLVVMLRTRQYRTGSEVLLGLVSGILGLFSTAVASLWLHEDWRPTIAVVLAASGGVLLAATLLPAAPSVRRGRLGDVLETICLLAMVPLLLLAVGVFDAIAG